MQLLCFQARDLVLNEVRPLFLELLSFRLFCIVEIGIQLFRKRSSDKCINLLLVGINSLR